MTDLQYDVTIESNVDELREKVEQYDLDDFTERVEELNEKIDEIDELLSELEDFALELSFNVEERAEDEDEDED